MFSFLEMFWLCPLVFGTVGVVIYLYFLTVSFRVWCPDNVSLFEVGADHWFEQRWNGCYIQATKCFLD